MRVRARTLLGNAQMQPVFIITLLSLCLLQERCVTNVGTRSGVHINSCRTPYNNCIPAAASSQCCLGCWYDEFMYGQ